MSSKSNRIDLFILEYLKDPHGTKAAIKAGFSEKTAHVQASRLLKNVKVRESIEKHRENMAIELKVTRESMTTQFDEDRDFSLKLKNPSAAVAASSAKAKLHGLFTDNLKLSGDLTLGNKTDAQLDAMLAKEIPRLPLDVLANALLGLPTESLKKLQTLLMNADRLMVDNLGDKNREIIEQETTSEN